MSVLIKNVIPGSPADLAGIKSGNRLISVDGCPINDVLDYMFYADDDMGLEFGSFLMDKKRSCGNNCIFCFIDQLPPKKLYNLRKTLYFKDDDSRLSFLQGNYITLTNLTEHDIDRIIKMRTPVNVSVHTTNPELRVKMMGNPKAGAALDTLYRFAEAEIPMNCQLVLCPEINDGEELLRSLRDLAQLESVGSIACVPVGLTKFHTRSTEAELGLPQLRCFGESEAADVIRNVGGFKNTYSADEFYLTANLPIPEYEHYGDFPQYENGIGMWAYMKRRFMDCIALPPKTTTGIATGIVTAIVTGTAAEPLLSELVKPFTHIKVFAIRNEFFGESVTVSGLLTGGDIIRQLRQRRSAGEEIGDEILIGANTLNADGLFLDDVTPSDIEKALGVKVKVVETDGVALADVIK